jgi:hypothetical protein
MSYVVWMNSGLALYNAILADLVAALNETIWG